MYYSLSMIFVIILMVSNIYAQENNNEDGSKPVVYNWGVSLKGGASLIWGDAGSSFDPFTHWFSNECAFTGEIVLDRRLSNVFGVQLGFAKGVLSGYREIWSSETHPVASSKTDYFDYHLDLNVDLTAIFNHNQNRFLSIYAFGGVGMINYTATSYLDGKQYQTAADNTLIIPWGGGLKLRINPRFSILLETSFRNTFVDDIDAYIGQGTTINDIYSITGVGLTYRFGAKKDKERQIEVVPVVPADTSIAVKEVQEKRVLTEVVIISGMPVTAKRDTSYQVNVKIRKDSLNDFGRYKQEVPVGFSIAEDNSNGGQYSFANQELIIDWKTLPIDDTLEFSYKLVTSKLEPKTYSFEGSFTYKEDTVLRISSFVDDVTVSMSSNELLAENPLAENPKDAQVSETDVVVPVISGVDYRVQVAAVFGGKSNVDVIARRLRINEEVFEDPYKRGYRYTVGHHNDYGQANSHRRNVSVNGAYVIAFVDGKYMGDLAKTNSIVMDQNAVNNSGVTYKIQIAASKGRAYSIAKLAYKYGFNTSDIYEQNSGVWYKYSVGKFTDLADAKSKLKEIQAKVKGAYIVKYIDGTPVR